MAQFYDEYYSYKEPHSAFLLSYQNAQLHPPRASFLNHNLLGVDNYVCCGDEGEIHPDHEIGQEKSSSSSSSSSSMVSDANPNHLDINSSLSALHHIWNHSDNLRNNGHFKPNNSTSSRGFLTNIAFPGFLPCCARPPSVTHTEEEDSSNFSEGEMIRSPDSGTLLVSGASPDDVGPVGCGRFDYYHCGECSEDEESPNRRDSIDVGDGDEGEVDFYDAVSRLGCDGGDDDSGGDGDSGDGITWPPPLPPAPTASWLQRMRGKEGKTEIGEPISVTMTN